MELLKNELGIKPLLDASDGVIVSSREKDGKEYIFAVNMKASPAFVRVRNESKDVLNGNTLSVEVKIDAYDTLFIEKER